MLGHLVGGHLSSLSGQDAVRILTEIIQNLHVVAATGGGVLYALAASPQLSDDIAALGSEAEDMEDDGTAELDHRRSPPLIESLLAPVERQGYPVPTMWPSMPFEQPAELATTCP